ncbi:uncharacterized protein LOC115326889 isoform X1 [Ixodes scapularis]|uniref:uncharacterized protein LOC115326889 isoform X1 n=1 Tax=Ixodes scapularis TaxID=6945 RepID=UPI001A9DDA9A|nr:uncharacterized protein LOC115326889 isoform X1 [Ixodes scapularis]
MAYLTHCCCGCMTVRTGTKVLAILSVMDALVGIIIYATFLVYQKEVAEVFDDLPSIKSSVEVKVGEFVAYIVIGVIGVIVSSLCVRGAYTDQRHYILPYLVFDFMVLVVQGILVIWLIIVVIANGTTQILLVVCIRLLWLCIWCYFYVVVLSFYKQLANAAHNPGICMVPADQPVSRGTYVPPRSYSSTAPEPQCYSDSKVALV